MKSFVIAPANGAALPPYEPGAHIDVHLGGLVRQYSLCSLPDDGDRYRIAVKREPNSRGGSRTLHDDVREGAPLSIGLPRNNFALRDAESFCLLVAGGIGITPLLAMARRLLATGRGFRLHYFTRSPQHTPFHTYLSAPDFADRVDFHYALEPDAVRAKLRRILWHRPEGAGLYLCGPRPFMDLVEQTAAPTWPPESVHLEYFSADPVALAGSRAAFRVRLARSGGEYAIAEGRSIVESLGAAGVRIETSCEQGVCGTCLTGVLEGVPDHRDVFLTDAEKAANDRMCPCVSRAHTDLLVLDR